MHTPPATTPPHRPPSLGDVPLGGDDGGVGQGLVLLVEEGRAVGEPLGHPPPRPGLVVVVHPQHGHLPIKVGEILPPRPEGELLRARLPPPGGDVGHLVPREPLGLAAPGGGPGDVEGPRHGVRVLRRAQGEREGRHLVRAHAQRPPLGSPCRHAERRHLVVIGGRGRRQGGRAGGGGVVVGDVPRHGAAVAPQQLAHEVDRPVCLGVLEAGLEPLVHTHEHRRAVSVELGVLRGRGEVLLVDPRPGGHGGQHHVRGVRRHLVHVVGGHPAGLLRGERLHEAGEGDAREGRPEEEEEERGAPPRAGLLPRDDEGDEVDARGEYEPEGGDAQQEVPLPDRALPRVAHQAPAHPVHDLEEQPARGRRHRGGGEGGAHRGPVGDAHRGGGGLLPLGQLLHQLILLLVAVLVPLALPQLPPLVHLLDDRLILGVLLRLLLHARGGRRGPLASPGRLQHHRHQRRGDGQHDRQHGRGDAQVGEVRAQAHEAGEGRGVEDALGDGAGVVEAVGLEGLEERLDELEAGPLDEDHPPHRPAGVHEEEQRGGAEQPEGVGGPRGDGEKSREDERQSPAARHDHHARHARGENAAGEAPRGGPLREHAPPQHGEREHADHGRSIDRGGVSHVENDHGLAPCKAPEDGLLS
mmetsp:Transcript_71578/g.226064  ORF Transcript_71578/g.226064 Transcript_71578/m.226064 type:complete len:640 (+) Transcript_71578:275-2194(+)